MRKKDFKPIDLGRLESRADAILTAFNRYNDVDRSDEYRNHHLQQAEQITRALVSDFRQCFDNNIIGGIEPYNLSKGAQ